MVLTTLESSSVFRTSRPQISPFYFTLQARKKTEKRKALLAVHDIGRIVVFDVRFEKRFLFVLWRQIWNLQCLCNNTQMKYLLMPKHCSPWIGRRSMINFCLVSLSFLCPFGKMSLKDEYVANPTT